MERDFLKRYVDEHKDAFEREALPPNMLGNILGNLKQREELREERRVQKMLKMTYTWLAVACSIFMVAGAYLFITQETDTITNPSTTIVSNTKKNIEHPVVEEVILPHVEKNVPSLQKRFVARQQKAEPHHDIYSGLADSSSVANRLNAVIKASTLASLNGKMKNELCRTFSEDENDNVRLAALEVLSKFSTDKYIQEHLVASLSKQKDPMVQLELVKIVGNNGNPETTEKLIAMANNPFTVDAVKEQVHYALLTNNN